MSMEKDFRFLCETGKREIIAFKHPVKKKYVIVRADTVTDMMSYDIKMIVRNQEEAEKILKDNNVIMISKSKLNRLMK